MVVRVGKVSGSHTYGESLPGYSGTSFTTPQIGDATVTRVSDVASGADLSYSAQAGCRDRGHLSCGGHPSRGGRLARRG